VKRTQYTSIGLSFLLTEPESAEEFDKLAGSVGACVSEANSNVGYRSTSPAIRAALCVALAALTGEPRKSKGKVNSKGEAVMVNGEQDTVPDETEKAYVNRLLSGQYLVADRAPLTKDEAQGVMNKLQAEKPELFVLDPSTTERSKKAPKEIELAADQIVAAIESGATSFERVFNNVANSIGCDVEELGEHNRDNLVSALVRDANKQAQDRANKFLA